MGFSSTMMQAAGTGVAAMGAYNQAQSQKAALENQAQIADWQASQAENVGQQQQAAAGLKAQALMGQQAANLAANGVQLGQGSAAEIMASSKFMSDRDQLTIRDNAMRTAWAYRTQADVERTMGSNISPITAGATSLLGGAAQVGASWNRWKQQGGTVPSWAS